MLHQLNILLHVTAGIAAIFFGVFAYLNFRNRVAHRRVGVLFLTGLLVVVLTAIIGVINFVDRPFLTVVTLQSAYLGFTGWRAVKRKAASPNHLDLLVTLVAVAFVVHFFRQLHSANIVWHQGVMWYILSYLLLILVFDLLRYLWPSLISSPRFWVYDHLFRITGAFTALASAGVGTVLGDWAPWSQIIPACLATVWLFFSLWYFPRQLLVAPKQV